MNCSNKVNPILAKDVPITDDLDREIDEEEDECAEEDDEECKRDEEGDYGYNEEDSEDE
jgi:hypothetical protein